MPLDTADLALDFDPDALREKYRAERDKRLRADGNDQYVEIKGDFAHYIDDPYVEPGFTRAPLTDDVDVADHRRRLRRPAGGGAAARSRRRRRSASSRRAATSAAPGTGTAIPARQCDIESYIYLPLLEETGYIPKEKYSLRAGDPRAQPRASARHFDLYKDACFQTEVTRIRWLRTSGAGWIIPPTAATP